MTGAGQGVGRQVALHFAANGAEAVIVNDFIEERAAAVSAEVQALGSKAIALTGDVTDYATMSAKIAEAVQQLGRLDILVNNAGNAGPVLDDVQLAPFWESEPVNWAPWLGTNLYGVLNVTRAAMPTILASGAGSVINIISDAGRVGEGHLPIYSAAKAGVAGFSRALAKSAGAANVRVNSISLGSINTPAVEATLANPEAMKKMLRHYVIRRVGEPTDVANMALFLASDASSWITGQTYPVNGGYSFSQ
ncbi:SDR family NAD(P)-dependent oxidoreductase [Streptomyces sp. NPDC002623]